MRLVDDRRFVRFRDHTIEVVENGMTKRVTLYIDGEEVAGKSCTLPQKIVLTGTVADHDINAKVVIRFLRHNQFSMEIDGVPVLLEKHT